MPYIFGEVTVRKTISIFKLRSEEIERVTKRESAIWRPDCFEYDT